MQTFVTRLNWFGGNTGQWNLYLVHLLFDWKNRLYVYKWSNTVNTSSIILQSSPWYKSMMAQFTDAYMCYQFAKKNVMADA